MMKRNKEHGKIKIENKKNAKQYKPKAKTKKT